MRQSTSSRWARIALASAAFAIPTVGCGTVFRFGFKDSPCAPPPLVYGGTALEIWMASGRVDGEDCENLPWQLRLLTGLDVPFSLAADSALLPISIPMEISRTFDCRSMRSAKDAA